MNTELRNVEVMKVSNGVIVRASYGAHSDRSSSLDDTLVFDSREAFVKWASEYFPKAAK